MSNKMDDLLSRIEDVVKSLPNISKDEPSKFKKFDVTKNDEYGDDLTIVKKKNNIFPDMEDGEVYDDDVENEEFEDVDEDNSGIVDVPNVPDKDYKTFVPLEEEDEDPEEDGTTQQNGQTQTDPNAEAGAAEVGDPNNPDPNTVNPNDPNAGMTGNMAGMGGDQGNIDPMTGMPEKSDKEIGRIYELKKIFSRLVSIESYLSVSSDENILLLRNYVVKAIELFKMLIDNVNSFQDKIDEIIIMFYQFLKRVYIILKKYYDYLQKQDKKK
jgi:hypothetical protein